MYTVVSASFRDLFATITEDTPVVPTAGNAVGALAIGFSYTYSGYCHVVIASLISMVGTARRTDF